MESFKDKLVIVGYFCDIPGAVISRLFGCGVILLFLEYNYITKVCFEIGPCFGSIGLLLSFNEFLFVELYTVIHLLDSCHDKVFIDDVDSPFGTTIFSFLHYVEIVFKILCFVQFSCEEGFNCSSSMVVESGDFGF